MKITNPPENPDRKNIESKRKLTQSLVVEIKAIIASLKLDHRYSEEDKFPNVSEHYNNLFVSLDSFLVWLEYEDDRSCHLDTIAALEDIPQQIIKIIEDVIYNPELGLEGKLPNDISDDVAGSLHNITVAVSERIEFVEDHSDFSPLDKVATKVLADLNREESNIAMSKALNAMSRILEEVKISDLRDVGSFLEETIKARNALDIYFHTFLHSKSLFLESVKERLSEYLETLFAQPNFADKFKGEIQEIEDGLNQFESNIIKKQTEDIGDPSIN